MSRHDANERPALPDRIEVGDPLIVRLSPNRSRGRTTEEATIPVVVERAARVWLTLVEPTGRIRARWRMRRDSQDEGTQYSGSNDRFVTPEQHAWETRLSAADKLLREQGIDCRHGGKWSDPARRMLLGDLVHAALNDIEAESDA